MRNFEINSVRLKSYVFNCEHERGKLIWAALGPKTLELIHENVSVEDVVKDEDILELDSEIIQKFIDGDTSQKKKTKKLEIDLRALILKHPNDPRFMGMWSSIINSTHNIIDKPACQVYRRGGT